MTGAELKIPGPPMERGHNGKVYRLTVGERVKPSDCTQMLSGPFGFNIRYVELADDHVERPYVEMFGGTPDIREKLRSLGVPDVPWDRVRPDAEWPRERADGFR